MMNTLQQSQAGMAHALNWSYFSHQLSQAKFSEAVAKCEPLLPPLPPLPPLPTEAMMISPELMTTSSPSSSHSPSPPVAHQRAANSYSPPASQQRTYKPC